MVTKFRVIASGSNGNSAYLSTPEGTLIIDAGISRKRILGALKEDNIPVEEVCGILISHSHTDHCLGLPVLTDKIAAPIYGTTGTKLALQAFTNDYRWKSITNTMESLSYKKTTSIGPFQILPLKTLHDAPEAACFVINANNHQIATITDTGNLTDEHIDACSNSDVVLMEMNHDLTALQFSARPKWLKERIKRVHMTNERTLTALEMLLQSKIRALFVGHLSGECNSPTLVTKAINNWASRGRAPWNWYLCKRDVTSQVIEMSGGKLMTKMPAIPIDVITS